MSQALLEEFLKLFDGEDLGNLAYSCEDDYFTNDPRLGRQYTSLADMHKYRKSRGKPRLR